MSICVLHFKWQMMLVHTQTRARARGNRKCRFDIKTVRGMNSTYNLYGYKIIQYPFLRVGLCTVHAPHAHAHTTQPKQSAVQHSFYMHANIDHDSHNTETTRDMNK